MVKEDRPGQERKFTEITLKDDKIKKQENTETYGAEKAKLFPTSAGMIVNDFLVANFEDIVDYSFTAHVEKDFGQHRRRQGAVAGHD